MRSSAIIRIACVLLTLALTPEVVAQSRFVHPGISHKMSDLERIKRMVEAGKDPWFSSYQELAADSKASYNYVVRGDPSFTELGRDSGVNYGAWNSDIRAAYYNAIRWIVTGDARHADKAVEIFNAWRNLTSVTSGGTHSLSGGVGYIMIEAAEIIKSTYSGWSASEIQSFSDMLVYPGYSTTSAPSGNKTFYWMAYQGDSGRHGNQGLSGWRTVMAMGIFLDNEIMYDRALRHAQGLPHRSDDLPYPSGPRVTKALLSSNDYVDTYSTTTYDTEPDYGYNGVMTRYIWENGQCQESSRDQQHVFFGLGLLCSMAEMAWNQGDDLYAHADDRLLLGLEYSMRHNVSNIRSYPDQPEWWVPTVESGEFIQRLDRSARWFSKAISPDGVGGFPNVRPIFEMPLAHYQGRGLKTAEEVKWIERARDVAIEESGYEVAGWSNDGIGWGALTFRRPDECHGDPISGFSSGLPDYAMNELPGTIEAENFDHFTTNGEGHTYHDLTETNDGGQYRTSAGVDITTCSEGGYALTSLQADEWMNYTVAVPYSGLYDISIRYAASQAGGRIKFSFDGLDKTTEVAIPFGAPDSNGPTDWQTLTVASGVSLSQGVQAMKVSIAGTSDAFLLNNLSIARDPVVLAGHWKFDEATGSDVADSSSNELDGTHSNASWIDGVDGGALDFDGSSSQVVLQSSSFNSIGDQVTVSMWVNGGSQQPEDNSVFYAVSGNTRVLNVHLPWGDSNVYWDAGNDGGYDRINKVALESEFKDGWNHWAFTKDAGTGIMKIYLNGTLWHSGLGKTKSMTGITAGTIGSQISGFYYDGAIDDVRLYDVALTDQEIAELHYQTPMFRVGGLVAEATGSTQIDLNWNAVAGATAYRVKRSLTAGGPYSLLEDGLTSTTHLDDGLSTGTAYHYVVSAVFNGAEGAESAPASAIPSSPTGTVPVIVTDSLPGGTVGVTYHETLLATDGDGELTWSLVSGALPSGLDLSSDGILSGTPSIEGSGDFSVMVSDADDDADTQVLSISIEGASEVPAVKLAVGAGAVAASEYQDPNAPANTLDLDFDSRWSAQGDGQWIRYDLGALKQVLSLKIAWLNGASRVASFDVEVSDDDVTWNPISTGLQSSGATTALETVDVPDSLARYVRIVGYGNSTNNGWNSITEVEIWGVDPLPPAAPSSIMSTPGDGQVALSWAVSEGATQYHVKRSSMDGGGFSTVASTAEPSYLDTSVVNGTTYQYMVSAEGSTGESADSPATIAKPHAPISQDELLAPAMTLSGDRLGVTLQSVRGRLYQLQRNETLAPEGWDDIGDLVIGDGTSINLFDPDVTGLPRCFYRVEIQP